MLGRSRFDLGSDVAYIVTTRTQFQGTLYRSCRRDSPTTFTQVYHDCNEVVLCATVEKFGPSAATPWLKVVLGFFSESCACFCESSQEV